MGVQISGIIPKKEIEITDLSGKKIAIDSFNILYQFLSIIRDRMTGEPLRDHKGRITSHLSGLLYRTSNLIEAGIRPIFVFDGEPPAFKKHTSEAREAAKKEAETKWKEALEKGEEAIKYAQAASRLTDEMIEDSKKLLEYMGIPYVQAKSEGEAQCAYMCKKKIVDFSGSQDFDSILFGSPKLVRNLSITGRRKLPGKEAYIEIKPEIIELEKVLSELGVTREQMIILGILIGTDYNPNGIKGFGPKTALKLIKEEKTLKKVFEKVSWNFDISPEDIFNFFISPPVSDKNNIDFKQPDSEKIIKFMVGEHDFSEERIKKVVDKLQQSFSSGRQVNLKGFFKK